MKLKLFIFNIFFFYFISSYGQTHVGDGGGEAENIVLEMSLGAPYWAKTCNENPKICGDFQFSSSDLKALTRKVAFEPLKKIKNSCDSNYVLISHESLYVKLDKPKKYNELAEILVKTLLMCNGRNIKDLSSLKFHLDPRMKVITPFSLVLFSGPSGDLITASDSFALAQKSLTEALHCTDYRILSWRDEFLSVKCLMNHLQYLVLVKKINSIYEFTARIDSEE